MDNAIYLKQSEFALLASLRSGHDIYGLFSPGGSDYDRAALAGDLMRLSECGHVTSDGESFEPTGELLEIMDIVCEARAAVTVSTCSKRPDACVYCGEKCVVCRQSETSDGWLRLYALSTGETAAELLEDVEDAEQSGGDFSDGTAFELLRLKKYREFELVDEVSVQLDVAGGTRVEICSPAGQTRLRVTKSECANILESFLKGEDA